MHLRQQGTTIGSPPLPLLGHLPGQRRRWVFDSLRPQFTQHMPLTCAGNENGRLRDVRRPAFGAGEDIVSPAGEYESGYRDSCNLLSMRSVES